jgi:hypothetical protein
MDALQQLKIDSHELNIKIGDLRNFITSKKFSKLKKNERFLLVQQLQIMSVYNSILCVRFRKMDNRKHESTI